MSEFDNMIDEIKKSVTQEPEKKETKQSIKETVTPEMQLMFDKEKKEHPDWSDEDIWKEAERIVKNHLKATEATVPAEPAPKEVTKDIVPEPKKNLTKPEKAIVAGDRVTSSDGKKGKVVGFVKSNSKIAIVKLDKTGEVRRISLSNLKQATKLPNLKGTMPHTKELAKNLAGGGAVAALGPLAVVAQPVVGVVTDIASLGKKLITK